MKKTSSLSLSVFSVFFSLALFGATTATALADAAAIDFESPTYAVGNINGQDGWSSTGAFDQGIVSTTTITGAQSFRISDAVTSGSFGDQTFSKSLVNEAGETDALNGGVSGGARQTHFEAQFDLASATTSPQPGMHLSVSPDRGDGSRMSYLRFEISTTTGGLDVFFVDVQGTNNPATFVETPIATGLSTSTPHTVKFVMDFVEGPSNDVVRIFIDNVLVHTGTSWENYFRFDPESNPTLVSNSRTVDSLLFREAGTAIPADLGKGFLIDSLSLLSSVPLNLAPAAQNVSASTTQETPTDIILTASDANADTLTFATTTSPANGVLGPVSSSTCTVLVTLTGTSTTCSATVTYTPNLGFTGLDTFAFKANDGLLDSNIATSTITVTAPVVVTSPSLGTAATFGVLASTFTNTTVTTVNGDVGYTTAPAVPAIVSGTVVTHEPPQAGLDQATALASLNSQACTFTFAAGAINLAADVTHGPLGVYTPGVYCVTGAASIGTAGITLSGAGTHIFRITGALTSVVNSHVTLTAGATANNVFWTPVATTLGANTSFVGTVIDDSGITVGASTTWSGRALAFGGTVTTDTDTITVPGGNIAPVADNVSASTTPSVPVDVTLTASDANGDTLTFATTTSPSNGVLGPVSSSTCTVLVTLTGTSSTCSATVTYTPNVSFSGSDTFNFRANDGTVNSNVATATIAVVAPTAATVTIDPASLLQTFDGTPKSATATTSPAGLSVGFTYNGSPTAPIAVGSYLVVATITDPGFTGAATSTLTIARAATHTLTYTAGANGSISGASPQTVNDGGSGSTVTAVANAGFHFAVWSDGVATASRTDTQVIANISATASFAADVTSVSFTTVTNGNGSLSATTTLDTLATTTASSILAALTIPANTVITGPATWNGTVTLPVSTTTFTLTPDAGTTASVLAAIEVGAGDTPLTFDIASKLTFVGQAGNLTGWSQAGVFHPITTICADNTQATNDLLAAGADCKIDVGADLVVWTKHFTTFIVYTQTAIPPVVVNSGGGGGGGGSISPVFLGASGGACFYPSATQNPDVTRDGIVDISDFEALMIGWGVGGTQAADITHDCQVDILDFEALMIGWS